MLKSCWNSQIVVFSDHLRAAYALLALSNHETLRTTSFAIS